MPTGRYGAGGAGVDGKFYISGGQEDATSILSKLESYDVATSSWTTFANMPGVRRYFGAVAYDDRIYAIGGDDGNFYLGTNQYFNTSANTWSTTTAMPTPRRYVMAEKFLGNIIVAGGELIENQAVATTAIVEALNPTSNTWSSVTSLSDSRDTGGIVVIGKKIYIVGGGKYIGQAYSVSASILVGEIKDQNPIHPLLPKERTR